MKKTWFSVGQIVVTLIVVVIAALVLWKLIGYYMFAPWTRDGHVRADVIEVAPDVSGLITSVQVVDNQPVRRGQVLFVIDQARYTLALREAEAAVVQRRATVEQQHAVIEQQRAGIQQQRATLDQARREDIRNRGLGNLVAKETSEESHTKVEQAEAGVATAQAGLANAQAALDVAQAALANAEVAVNTAQLNLQRTTVVSPVDGYLNDRAPRVGEYTAAGHAVLAVVDLHSFRVDGYFEETKLGSIHVGEPVDIEVMGESRVLRGHVVSIVAAIEDRDRQPSSNLLPNVNPSFSWVRLAQRIPVRVALDEVPDDFRMIAGRTATVSVRGGSRRAASDAQAASAPGSAALGSPASGAAGASDDGAAAASAPAVSGSTSGSAS